MGEFVKAWIDNPNIAEATKWLGTIVENLAITRAREIAGIHKGHCRECLAYDDHGDGVRGFCRRTHGQERNRHGVPSFPIVGPTDWCLEFVKIHPQTPQDAPDEVPEGDHPGEIETATHGQEERQQ